MARIGRRSDTVEEIALGDELTLFDTATGTALALNRTARAIWERADGTTPLDSVVAEFADAYGVSWDEMRRDLVTALQTLEEAGVVMPAT